MAVAAQPGSQSAAPKPSPLKRIEVHTYTTQERSLTLQTSRDSYKLGTQMEKGMESKPHEVV